MIGRIFAGCPCFFLVFGRDVSIPDFISTVVCWLLNLCRPRHRRNEGRDVTIRL